MNLNEATDAFIEDYIWAHGYVTATEENYRLAVNSFIKAVGDIKLTKVTLEHVKKWRRWMERHHYEINSVNSYMYRFRLLIRYYNRKIGLGMKLQADEIIVPKRRHSLPRFLTVEEVDRMIEVADLREKAIIAVLYDSAMRVGELIQLRKSDVQGDTIRVRGKGNKERMVFIHERAKPLLKAYLDSRTDSCPFLFYSYRKGGLGKVMIQHNVKQLGIKAGIEKVCTPHVLRHSMATHLAQAGISPFHLQRLLGHAHISTTQIYVHLGGKDVHDEYLKKYKSAKTLLT